MLVLDGADPSTQPFETLECHRGPCYCIALDPKGRYFATGAADAIVAVWDANELVCVQSYCKLEGQIRQLSFSHDGNYIATASEDDVVDIFNSSTGNSSFTYSFLHNLFYLLFDVFFILKIYITLF